MRRPFAALVVTALVGGALVSLGAATATAAVDPTTVQCDDAQLTTPGTTTDSTGSTRTIIIVSDTSTVGISDTATVDIPAGVTSLDLDVCGAEGASSFEGAGGLGARMAGSVTITSPVSLRYVAGSQDGLLGAGGAPGNGGGAPGTRGGYGGGFSGVFGGAPDQTTALAVAGGGGGAGSTGLQVPDGGNAGGPTGSTGSAPGLGGGGGATLVGVAQGSGGAPGVGTSPGSAGGALQGGAGGTAAPAGGGGGGGGYFGGGGGGATAVPFPVSGGGGGGSGYLKGSTPTPAAASGTRSGLGVVIIRYTVAASTVTTQASPPVTLGGSVSDTATVTTAGAPPTGTVTFTLYGPDDATCATAPAFTSTVAVSGGSANSGPFTPTAAGTYRFRATYNGDFDNGTGSSPCNAPNESTIVRATPVLDTQATNGFPAGTISDSATLTLGHAPTGTIQFDVFGPADPTCAGSPAASSTKTVAGNGNYDSDPYSPPSAGSYKWMVTYSGDATNDPAVSACGATNETSVVGKATPTVTTNASGPVTAGQSISDSATVTGGAPPITGTVTFEAYGPGGSGCTGTPAFASGPRPITNGDASSGSFAPTTAGSYRWVATYNGNASNNSVSGSCGTGNETSTVDQATPTMTTQATATVPAGGSVSDSATVTSSGPQPSGTVTFTLFGLGDTTCTGTPVFTSTRPLTNGDSNSGPYTPPAAGTYRWIAAYNGDTNTSSVSGTCGDTNEVSTVTKVAPTVTTQATATVPAGGSVSDSATVTSSGPQPSGTVTFTLFGLGDTTCTGTPVFTSTRPLTNGDSNSGPYTPPAAGTYRWIATYNGDTNTNSASGTCGDTNEVSTVTKVASAVTTQATPTATTGGSISDSATVTSAGPAPTGTVTFNLYGPADGTCTSTPVFTSTVPLTSGDANSGSFTPTSDGTYRWLATYNGDGNTNSSSGACNDPNESTAVNPPSGGGGGGGSTGGTSPSPTASPSASPTASPTGTATPSSSPSSPSGRAALSLSTDTPDIKPGQEGRLHATGTTGQEVQLYCYSRPSTTYVQVRPSEAGQGIAISNGSVDFSVFPGRNTRCFVQYLNDPSTASNSVVINVHTALSLSAYRDGVRRYHFQGTNLPRRAGQLITLYRYARSDNNGFCDPHPAAGDFNGASTDPNCVAIRTATATTNSSNVWRIDRSFTGSGRFVFVARTSQTLTNAAGVSNFRLTIVH